MNHTHTHTHTKACNNISIRDSTVNKYVKDGDKDDIYNNYYITITQFRSIIITTVWWPMGDSHIQLILDVTSDLYSNLFHSK